MDYSKTVNLPKTDFPMKADLPKREPAFLERWEKENVYEKALQRRADQKDKKQFILHDGPPYANGHLHLGHALNKILKDIIVRYKTMAGYYAPYVPGWDCHGLPIELQLMKELKVADKHKVNRQEFREQARAFAQKFVDIQRQEFKRMGVLGDWDHPYLTMDPSYTRAIHETFQRLVSADYIYRAKKPVYWCFVDETALAEAEVEYENDPGPSIYVAFPLHAPPNFSEDAEGHGDEKKAQLWVDGSVSFVIWTTTPWTLPANVAIAFNPNERYVLFENSHDRKKYIVAQARLEHFEKICGLSGKALDEVPGHNLQNALAKHPWIEDRVVDVLPAHFVAMDTGTGLVHIAPGHGMEDYQLGIAHDLEVLSPVDDRGRFTEEVPQWKGEHVFKANPRIIEFLKEKGVLLHAEEITHSYPHCWRCHKPVIFRATEQTFLNMEKDHLREKLLHALEHVAFIPEFGRNRITGMIKTRPDWCLSRQRLWGTEIPAQGPQKEPDIVDVWFESGVSWAAVLQQRPELAFPADLYLEGSDQHRGWFQTSLIPSVALEGRAPYKSVLTHGFVMDGEGRPMSKSLGNVISPEEIIQQYGADVLRLWVASSDYGGDVRLSAEILKGLTDNYRKVRNTLRYLLNNLTDFDPQKHAVTYPDLEEIDRWALHRLQEKIRDTRQSYEKFEFYRIASSLVVFCSTDLSGYYLDSVKDRLYCETVASRSRRSAQTVLYELAHALIRLLAPLMPFTAEECWQFLGKTHSVALEDLPMPKESLMDAALGAKWERLLDLRNNEVLHKLEMARAGGRVKAPREAKVQLRFQQGDTRKFFQNFGDFLSGYLSVGQTEILDDPIDVVWEANVEKADGKKCARCWIYKTDVGAVKSRPDICGRCADAVEEWMKSHPELATGVKS